MLKSKLILPNRFKKLKSAVCKPQVFFAYDDVLQQKVWVKGAQLEQTNIQKEYDILNTIDSPHVVKALDYLIKGSNHFIVLENIPGKPLGQILRKKITKIQRKQIAKIIFEGFVSVERADFLYRDFLDSHVIVHKTKKQIITKLIDFNNIIRDKLSEGRFNNPHSQGPYFSMSPEDFRQGSILMPSSNVYSLACLIYKLFTGHYPMDELIASGISPKNIIGSSAHKNISQSLNGGANLSKHEFGCIKTALAFEPERRWQSISNFFCQFWNEEPPNEDPPAPKLSWIIPEKLAVSSRPGFLQNRILRRSNLEELQKVYKLLSNDEQIDICICLLSTNEIKQFFPKANVELIGKKTFDNYFVFPMSSKPIIDKKFISIVKKATMAIKKGQKVLIHCNGGVGRACTLASCVLHEIGSKELQHPYTHSDLITFVRKKTEIKNAVENEVQEHLVSDFIKNKTMNNG